MRKDISLSELNCFIALLSMLGDMGLLGNHEVAVMWEKRPAMIINKLGNLEYENPEEIYGCKIELLDIEDLNNFGTGIVASIRFNVNGE